MEFQAQHSRNHLDSPELGTVTDLFQPRYYGVVVRVQPGNVVLNALHDLFNVKSNWF